MNQWVVYCLYLNNYTYIGATVNLDLRLRRHNGEFKGGAKYTTSKGPGWKCAVYVTGFKNQKDALKFEWAWKHITPRGKRVIGRIKQLEILVHKKHWTMKAVSSVDYPLEIILKTDEIKVDSLQVPEYISITQEIDELKEEENGEVNLGIQEN